MNKKKAVICTIMFSIVIYGVYIALIFALPHKLFRIVPSIMAGFWMAERVEKFFEWLIKDIK